MSAVAAAPVEIHRPLPPEEAARANFHALLARLFHSPADDALLQSLAQAEPIDGDAALSKAWAELGRASAAMDADAAGEEYDALFIGVGKAAVSVYAGFYTGAAAIDHPRVRLQADFAAFGLEHVSAGEPEDHLATLFDVMRVLVAGGAGRSPAPLDEQKRFFDAYLRAAAPKFFNAVIACEKANYYRRVAALGQAFIAIESESFELD
jgi:TorA maturation chaperone TorD